MSAVAKIGASCSTRLRPLLAAMGLVTVFAASAALPSHAAAQAGSAAVTWGENFHDQLGAGYKDNWEASPVSVLGLSDITAVAAGYHFNLALLADGTVQAWGGNVYGQLGDGTRVDAPNPVPVSGLSDVTAISAAGTHAIALMHDGTVMVWGSNEYGELGNGVLNPLERKNKKGQTETTMVGTGSPAPIAVPGVSNVIAVAAGRGTDFAVLADGTVLAWGKNNAGQLGIGETGPETCKTGTGESRCSTTPRAVALTGLPEGVRVTEVSAGEEAAYALLSDHQVRAWGANATGELGNGTTTRSVTPVTVSNVAGEPGSLGGAVSVSGGSDFALALLEDGQVASWGIDTRGQLGAASSGECGKRQCSKTPVLVSAPEGLTSVSAGELGFGLATSSAGAYSFGRNSPWGFLGVGSPDLPETCGVEGAARKEASIWCSRTPIAIGGLGPVTTLAAGEQSNVAVLQSGEGPAPLMSVTPEVHAIRITWRFPATEFKLRWKPIATKRWGKAVKFTSLSCSAEGPCSYIVNGVTTPLEFELNSFNSSKKVEKQRQIVGAPMPELGAPVATVPPTISGIGHVGQALHDVAATWSNRPTSFTYQWLRCTAEEEACAPIPGATSQTYVPVTADLNHTLRVAETATNATAATTAVSGTLTIVSEAAPEEEQEVEKGESEA